MAKLAESFVCVRIQSMNGVNLEQFPFDYDLTWMSFFQDSAGRTYVRYGGREDRDPESHLNQPSLLKVMRQALALHREGKVQPDNRYEPVARSVRTPEAIPPMQGMLAKREEKCIHCHDVKVAQLRHLGELGRLQKEMVYTYPSPSRLGLHLDPVSHDLVDRVDDSSPAASAGLQPGDRLRTMDSQRVLTFADMTRVLELAPATGKLNVTVERNGQTVPVSVPLPAGWRNGGDPSWRASTGALGPGSGFWGVAANADEKRKLGVSDDALAIRVTFLWAPWIKATGLKLGDYVVAIDGQKSHMTIRQLQTYLHLHRNWGDRIELVVRRGDRELTMPIQFPEQPPPD